MSDLFSKDPFYGEGIVAHGDVDVKKRQNGRGNMQYRLGNGRYANKEQALSDKYSRSIKFFSTECERWKRAYLAVAQDHTRLERENERLRAYIREHVGNDIEG